MRSDTIMDNLTGYKDGKKIEPEADTKASYVSKEDLDNMIGVFTNKVEAKFAELEKTINKKGEEKHEHSQPDRKPDSGSTEEGNKGNPGSDLHDCGTATD